MTHPPLVHVVLGASGGAGSAIVTALADAGQDTIAVNRAGDATVPDGVRRRAADVATAAGAAEAVAGADVVYMAAQPAYHRWPEEFPPMLQNVIDAVEAIGGKLVMVDNLYSYGPGSSPMTEHTEQRATDPKGETRRRMIEMLRAAHDRGAMRVVIARASDYFGPGADNSGVTELAVLPAAKPKAALRWFGTLDQPHSIAYLPDIGRAHVTLGIDERADGEIWHLPHPPPVTGGAFLDMVDADLGAPRPHKVVSRMMLRLAAPFHRISRESLGVLYQWTAPFVVDDEKFEKTFGPFERTPMPDAIAATLDHYGRA